MILFDDKVYNALVNTGIEVIAGYPTEYHKLPILCYTCENNSTARKTDGREVTTYLSYKLDFFYDLGNIADDIYLTRIDNAMTNLGFKRTMYTNLQEPEGFHVILRYEVYVDETGYTWDYCY